MGHEVTIAEGSGWCNTFDYYKKLGYHSASPVSLVFPVISFLQLLVCIGFNPIYLNGIKP
jgi:hypothetical protein